MLIKHSFVYLLGRLAPALVSLATLSLYTRMLSATEYGNYALIIAVVGVVNAILFQWLSLSLGRFLTPTASGQALLSAALTGFLIVVVLTAFISGIIAWRMPEPATKHMVIITLIICWAQAWFDLNVKILNVRLQAVRYSVITSCKAITTFALGILLFFLGLGLYGILFGLLVGLLLPTFFLRKQWEGVWRIGFDSKIFASILRYGVPLTLSFGSVMILSVADRFFIKSFLNSESVGMYAAAFDLTQQSLGMLMVVINLAAFPLVIQAAHEKSVLETQKKLRESGEVLLAISVPAAVGLFTLSENIAFVFLGPEFRYKADQIISIVALTTLVNGIRSYYFDYSFHISKKVQGQIFSIAAAAICNILLNIIFIPIFGIMGAAYASLLAAIVGLGMSRYLGKKVFPTPNFSDSLIKIIIAACGMGYVLSLIAPGNGVVHFLVQIIIGAVSYLLLIFALDVHRIRQRFVKYLRVRYRNR